MHLDPPRNLEGTRVGRYRLLAPMVSDGVTATYLARRRPGGPDAIVKMFSRGLRDNTAILRRFFRAAEALTAVKHPRLVEIYETGIADGGHPYIAMQALAGESLADKLRRTGPLPVPTALAIARQVAIALEAAHAFGAIHGALTPANVFLRTLPAGGEHVVLLELGIAIVVDDLRVLSAPADTMQSAYSSPERCRGSPLLDARADLYSLGCILYEMVTGRPPFTSPVPGQLSAMHMILPAPRVRVLAPWVGDEVASLLMQLLAKAPDDRPPSAADVVDTLDRLVDPDDSLEMSDSIVELLYDCDDELRPATAATGTHEAVTSRRSVATSPDGATISSWAMWLSVSLVFLAVLGVAVVVLSSNCRDPHAVPPAGVARP
jgi:eukaryotic-like serine/threonine-protein kinase